MPVFTRGDVRIAYDLLGDPAGAPLLLIAPGGMRSERSFWAKRPGLDPREVLTERRLVAMDQRNAGESFAPVGAEDGWATYAADQLALLDHLGVDQFDVLGMCIGGPYIMGLIAAAPERVRRAVMFQPIGLADNRHVFVDLFDGWVEEIRDRHPEADPLAWAAFRARMFGGEFMFGASEQDVRDCKTPLLVFEGDDVYHPSATSRRVAELAPDARFVPKTWRTDPEMTWREVRSFLGA